ncbi:MAG: nucleotidyltransferase domain-containing protein [Verrucomicrobia bacterium]|nr:MAG: nucleotidyltransferase domain-containing protein [Verrucomicrobiota bacterium]
MIDLPPAHIETIKRLLAEHVPQCEIWAFGSRINQTAKDWSDLDLVVVGVAKLEQHALYDLREAFEESDLPIRIDVLDWHTISPEFQAVINAGYEVIQPAPRRIEREK